MPYTPRRYTMLHLGAMGMESLAPEFFNIEYYNSKSRPFTSPHTTTALSATRPRTLESAPSASVSPRCRAVHARAGVVPRDVYYCTTREQSTATDEQRQPSGQYSYVHVVKLSQVKSSQTN